MKPYVSIDIETTGLDDAHNMVLSVGAVIDDWTSPFATLPTFYCYVDNGDRLVGSPYALSMHPKILRYIAVGPAKDEPLPLIPIYKTHCVSDPFLQWLMKNGIDPAKQHITAAGKNFASFDRQFLKKLPYWTELVKTQHRSIDPGNLYFDPRIDLNGLPDTKTCMLRAGITGEVAHTALEDAMVVAKLVRNWFTGFSYSFTK